MQPKKDGIIKFLTDFHELNKNLLRDPFLIPTISEIFQSLRHFTHATTLDLSMEYYYLLLDNEMANLCSISSLFGTFRYKCLP